MNTNPSPPAAFPPPQPVPEPLLAAARAAVKQYFSGCFWFWRDPDVAIQDSETVRAVIENLRENGNHEAWRTAQKLQRMVLQCH